LISSPLVCGYLRSCCIFSRAGWNIRSPSIEDVEQDPDNLFWISREWQQKPSSNQPVTWLGGGDEEKLKFF
jgi:hypothetical protein